MAIAFPGAQGWAAGAQGARAGSGTPDVYWVTNTNDSGSGSFRQACEASGPRYIAFKIGGLITLQSTIEIENPYCTILGQTAPGGGITLTRAINDVFDLMKFRTDEIIVRYLRFRGSSHLGTPSHGGDCFQIGNRDRAEAGNAPNNIIIDHCSCSGGTDETIEMWSGADRITVQWCIVGPPLQNAGHTKSDNHGFGTIMGGRYGSGRISCHHLFYVHCSARTPMVSVGSKDETLENHNCITYNAYWRTGDWASSHWKDKRPKGAGWSYAVANIQGNVHRIGLDRVTDEGWMFSGNDACELYFDGNEIWETDGTNVTGQDGYDLIRPGDNFSVGSPNTVAHSYDITIEDAADAFESVMNGVGCTIPQRDRIDALMVSHARNGTGSWIDKMSEIGGIDTPATGTPWNINSTYDMPQSWLDENGNHDFTDIAPSGYSYGEEFAHSLSGDVSPPGPSDPPVVPPPTAGGGTPIAASADDATSNEGTTGDDWNNDGTAALVGHFSATEDDAKAYFRFDNIGILADSTIDDARLRLYMSGKNGTIPDMRIQAFDTDDAAAITSRAIIDSGLASLTTAYVDWTPTSSEDEWKTSPNISSVLEEVVARPGWVSGNAIVFVVRPQTTSYTVQERAKFRTYDSDQQLAATLELGDISDPGGGVEAPTGESDSGTYTFQPSATGYEGYSISGDSSVTNNAVRCYVENEAVAADTGYQTHLLLPNVTIPQGATITAASFEYEIGSAKDTSVDVRYLAWKTDDATLPTTWTNIETINAAVTTAYVDESLTGVVTGGTRYDTVDFSAVIEEVVGQDDWVSGNDILFLVRGQDYASPTTTNKRLGYKTYTNGPTDGSTFTIDWSIFVAVSESAKKSVDVGLDFAIDSGIQ